jgi:hypothetical protein
MTPRDGRAIINMPVSRLPAGGIRTASLQKTKLALDRLSRHFASPFFVIDGF